MSWLNAKKKKQANNKIENDRGSTSPVLVVQKAQEVKKTDIGASSETVAAIAMAIFMDGVPAEIVAVIAYAIFIASEEGTQEAVQPASVALSMPTIGWVLQGRIQSMQDRMLSRKF